MQKQHTLGLVPVRRHTKPGYTHMIKYEGERILVDPSMNIEQIKVLFDDVATQYGHEYKNIRLSVDDYDCDIFFVGDREPREIELQAEKEIAEERTQQAKAERYEQYLLLKKEFDK